MLFLKETITKQSLYNLTQRSIHIINKQTIKGECSFMRDRMGTRRKDARVHKLRYKPSAGAQPQRVLNWKNVMRWFLFSPRAMLFRRPVVPTRGVGFPQDRGSWHGCPAASPSLWAHSARFRNNSGLFQTRTAGRAWQRGRPAGLPPFSPGCLFPREKSLDSAALSPPFCRTINSPRKEKCRLWGRGGVTAHPQLF